MFRGAVMVAVALVGAGVVIVAGAGGDLPDAHGASGTARRTLARHRSEEASGSGGDRPQGGRVRRRHWHAGSRAPAVALHRQRRGAGRGKCGHWPAARRELVRGGAGADHRGGGYVGRFRDRGTARVSRARVAGGSASPVSGRGRVAWASTPTSPTPWARGRPTSARCVRRSIASWHGWNAARHRRRARPSRRDGDKPRYECGQASRSASNHAIGPWSAYAGCANTRSPLRRRPALSSTCCEGVLARLVMAAITGSCSVPKP